MNGNKEQKTNIHSIKVRIAYALFATVVIQGLVLVWCIMITGAISKIEIATYDTLSNQADNRKNEIQNLFNTRRKNITNTSNELLQEIERILTENNISLDMLNLNSYDGVYSEILSAALDNIILFAKYNSVTGVFVVFDPSENAALETTDYRTSVYIRNSSPDITLIGNSNLLLEYGHVDIAKARGIAVDYLWTNDMSFASSDKFPRDFYFKPVNAAFSAIRDGSIDKNKPQLYGYWSEPFDLRKNDITVVTYSLPLILADNTVFGVMGFELEVAAVSNLMPSSEVPYDMGFYLMGVDSGEGFNNERIISSGVQAKQFLAGAKTNLEYSFVHESKKGTIYEIINPNYAKNKAIGAYNKIDLYETNSPFYNEQWGLTCLAPEASVMSGSTSVRNAIFISILSTSVFSLALSVFVILYISEPIHQLHDKVKKIDPSKPVRFERTGTREIDELAGEFEVLSDGVSEAAAKMFKIIELVDMPLGSFEIDYKEEKVSLSKSLFRLLGLTMPDNNASSVSIAEWDSVIGAWEKDSVTSNDDGITETLYMINDLWSIKRWFRMRMITEKMRDIGVLIDVTDEIMRRQRLEFERSYDSLTKLLNRQAFINRSFEMLRIKPNTIGIMMFADLDDLKFINDLYGHETGDDYIRTFAEFLERFKKSGAAVGRISGDEFAMFMNGFKSAQDAKQAFDLIFKNLDNYIITASDGSIHKTRVSVGLSYYPSDSEDINQLIKYADYAMYEIKHTIKGEVREFNVGSYNKNSFVLNMKNVLNQFIEEQLVRFAFQPIVDAKSGEIYAYEALMRSTMQELKSPDEIMQIARSQSKLYQIEKLTFTIVFNWLSANKHDVEGKKIFINSIPNQMFTEPDMNEFFGNYSYLLNRVVFEITENEFSSKEDTKKKMDAFREFGAMVAIDDYGSGYSNELALLFVDPHFLKIDMSIVRNVNEDTDKQQLIQNTIAYASKRNIKIIAEGVETYEEMVTLIGFGVDYMQGYYLSKPNFDIVDIKAEVKNQIIALSCEKI